MAVLLLSLLGHNDIQPTNTRPVGICPPDHKGSTPSWQLDYDRSFRQQAAADPSLQWNTLVPGLQASMILGHPGRQGAAHQRLSCTLCRGVDHSRNDCALAYLHPPTRSSPRYSNWQHLVCTSWNRGNCLFPGRCSFRHVCATCYLPHKARDCQQTPDTFPYKQRRPNMPNQGSS